MIHVAAPAVQSEVEIREVGSVPSDRSADRRHVQHEQDDEKHVIDGEDAEEPAAVENEQLAAAKRGSRRATTAKKYRGNQESAQDEEQMDAELSARNQAERGSRRDPVVKEDEENGNRSKAVELSHVRKGTVPVFLHTQPQRTPRRPAIACSSADSTIEAARSMP